MDSLLSPVRRQAMEILAQLRYPPLMSLSLLSFAPSPAPLSTQSHSLSPCPVSTEQVTSTPLFAPQLVPGGLAESDALFPTVSLTPPSLHPSHLLSQSHQACPECAGEGGAGEHLCAERVLPALGAGHAGERRGQGRGHPGEPASPDGFLGWGHTQKGQLAGMSRDFL